MEKKRVEADDEFSRRRALGLFAGAGAALAFGCGGSSTDDGFADAGEGGASAANGDSGSSTGGDSGGDAGGANGSEAGAGTDGGACEVSPEGEIGPYFSDDSDPRFNRSNIVANLDGTNAQVGIPLALTVTVFDTQKGCAPYANAQIDIWHCNAAGIYSDQAAESTTTETWLRGYQMTDANGKVTFTTVIPGWYAGRTTHIHVRVRSTYSAASSTSDGTNTTQVFFDQTLIDTLATTVAPYSAEGKNSTTNASDHVFNGETNGANLLSLSGDDTRGYTASIAIGLPITNEGTSTGGGGPGR